MKKKGIVLVCILLWLAVIGTAAVIFRLDLGDIDTNEDEVNDALRLSISLADGFKVQYSSRRQICRIRLCVR